MVFPVLTKVHRNAYILSGEPMKWFLNTGKDQKNVALVNIKDLHTRPDSKNQNAYQFMHFQDGVSQEYRSKQISKNSTKHFVLPN
jgi:hypothetical protein